MGVRTMIVACGFVACVDLSIIHTLEASKNQIYANPVILGGLSANGKDVGRCLPMLNS